MNNIKKKIIVAMVIGIVVCALSMGCLGPKTCDQCNGVGEVTCTKCGGDGVVEKKEAYKVDCERCGGDGQVISGGVDVLGHIVGGVTKDCPECGGSGKKTAYKTVESKCTACGGDGVMTCPKCNGKGEV